MTARIEDVALADVGLEEAGRRRLPQSIQGAIRLDKVRKAIGRFFRRSWWLMMVLILVAVAAWTYLQTYTEAQVFYKIQLYAYDLMPERDRALMQPPEFIMAPPITVMIRTAGRAGTTIVGWLAWTAALTLIVIFLGRKSPGFGSLLSVVVWAWTPILIRGLVQCAYMVVTGEAIFNPGLSGLIWDRRPEPPPMLMGLPGRPIHYPTQQEMALADFLGRIDIYTVWHLAAMALGLSKAAQTPRRKTLVAVVLGGIALAALATVPTLFGQALRRFRFF